MIMTVKKEESEKGAREAVNPWASSTYDPVARV
jgi:hypothetical protein